MSSIGRVKRRAIEAMLADCAPGSRMVDKPHHIWVYWNDKCYPSLPKGEHGKKPGQQEIQVGKVKQMIRHLGINPECAAKHF